MTLRTSSHHFIALSGRPRSTSTSGPVMPLLPFRGYQTMMVDGRIQSHFFPATGLAPASSLCFAAAGTSGESEKVTKKASIPVYVMLPLGVVDMNCKVADPAGLINDLKLLKLIGVHGVMVDCWWGIVESNQPHEYNWSGYRHLFGIISQLKLKLQVVMSFHKCGGNVGDDITIPLPNWVLEIGYVNPDIYFTDRNGQRNTDCVTGGIDNEPVLHGRTALQVYYDFMGAFRAEMDDFFEEGLITEIEVGLGPCGELRYPSYPMEHGWAYPGIGEFQCYDRYLMQNLRLAAREKGHPYWGKGPELAGTYNSQPQDTVFFRDGGNYDSFYGHFFLDWYSRVLVDHADNVLKLAKLVFNGSYIAAKIAGVHWWYKTVSHAAELTAGYYNSCNQNGYTPIAAILKSHNISLNFTCAELSTKTQNTEYPEAMSDPEGLVWQVLNAAWDAGIQVSSENALPCFDEDAFKRILEVARPSDAPDGCHLKSFTYLRLSRVLFNENNFSNFKHFVKEMHG